MKSKKALCMFLVGFAIVGICINIKTGISTAFSLSENVGLTGFIVYKVNEILNGNMLAIDIFFDPIGYLFMIFGIKLLGDKVKKSKLMVAAIAVAMVFSIAQIFIPLYVSDGGMLLKLTIATYIFEGIGLLYVIVRFVCEVKSKVDSYYNMEVGKDLTFATELFFFTYFVIIIVVFLCAIEVFFSKILLALDYVAMVYSILYFIYKTNKYNNQLKIFE